MKLLLISNSFGVNLQTYAQDIAKFNGYDLEIYTLYICGCSLENHVKNIEGDSKDYELYINGVTTSRFVSINEALKMDKWDVISLQQASHVSGYIDSYYPYFGKVFSFVKTKCPSAKIVFHKTWAYSSINSYKYEQVPTFMPTFTFKNVKEMKKGIDYCTNKIINDFEIWKVIRSGDVIEKAMNKIGDCYDVQGFHMNSIGSYLIGNNLTKQGRNPPSSLSGG